MKQETRKVIVTTYWSGYGQSLQFAAKESQKDNPVKLSAGRSDSITYHYYDRDHTLVLSFNHWLDYVGAQLINRDTLESIEGPFWDGDYNFPRPDLLDLSPCTIAGIIAKYF